MLLANYEVVMYIYKLHCPSKRLYHCKESREVFAQEDRLAKQPAGVL